MKSLSQKIDPDYIVYCSITHNNQDMKLTCLWMNKIKMCYIYIIINQPWEKKLNISISDNMDAVWGYYAKWNELLPENTVWYHLCLKSQKAKLKETEYNDGFQQWQGWGANFRNTGQWVQTYSLKI